jgi:HrpA-like RNA helicase
MEEKSDSRRVFAHFSRVVGPVGPVCPSGPSGPTLFATPMFEDVFFKLPIMNEANLEVLKKFLAAPGTVAITCSETSTGKTTGLPLMIAGLGPHHVVMVAVPTIPAVLNQRDFVGTNVRSRGGSGGGDLTRLVGHACDGDVMYTSGDRIVYATTKHVVNVLLRVMSGQCVLPPWFVLMADEAHHSGMDTGTLLQLALEMMRTGKLKHLVLASATLTLEDVDLRHLDVVHLGCGTRTYPIETVWNKTSMGSMNMHVVLKETVQRMCDEVVPAHAGSSVLVFVPGEAEAEKLAALLRAKVPAAEVWVMYSALSQEEMQRVMAATRAPVTSFIRIFVATNIAESSVTFGNVSCVVDTCFQKHLKLRGSGGSGVCLDVSHVTKKSAIQRAGRAGRTCSGTYYCMLTEAEFAGLEDSSASDLKRLYPVMPVLELLAARVNPDILGIEPAKLAAIMRDLVTLDLVRDSFPPAEPLYTVTDTGMMAQKFPVSLELAVVCTWMESWLGEVTATASATADVVQLVAAVLAAVAMVDGSQGGSFFWVPREYRDDKARRDAYVQEHFGKFRGHSDLCTYLELFDAMHRVEGDDFVEWTKENSLNNQLLRSARRTFRRLVTMVFGDKLRVDVQALDLSACAKTPAFMQRLYSIFSAAYKLDVFVAPRLIKHRMSYQDSKGNRYFVDTMRSFCTLPGLVKTIVAMQTMEVRNAASCTCYVSTLIPYVPGGWK